MMWKVAICVVVITICCHESSALYEDVKQYAKEVFQVLGVTKKGPGEYYSDGKAVVDSIIHNVHSDQYSVSQFTAISRKGQNEANVGSTIIQGLARFMEMRPFKAKLEDSFTDIHAQYQNLIQKLIRPGGTMNENWHTFAMDTYLEIRYKVRNLHHILAQAPGSVAVDSGLLKLIKSHAIEVRDDCGEAAFRLPHLLTDLIRTVMILEVEALAVLTFILPILSKGEEWVERITSEEEDFNERTTEYLHIVTASGNLLPGPFRVCDPENGDWVRGTSYHEMERFVQQVIFIDGSGWLPNCNSVGEDYNKGKDREDVTYYKPSMACKGTFSGCVKIKPHTACISEPRSSKRFEWMRDEDGKTLGIDINVCNAPNTRLAMNQARHCTCHCWENRNWVNVGFTESDIKNNMVITALRFIRESDVLHLQAKQGRLMKNGEIDAKSEKWIPLPRDAPTKNVNKGNRAFFFDDLMLPFEHALTGVGLEQVMVNGISGFAIHIEGLKFDYDSGEICSDAKCRSVQKSRKIRRIEIPYLGKNSVYKRNVTHTPWLEAGNFVNLHISSLLDDYGQSTLPLFDGIAVESNPPAPLGGAGLFMKAGRDTGYIYGGFIALRTYSIDYQQYLHTKPKNRSHREKGRPAKRKTNETQGEADQTKFSKMSSKKKQLPDSADSAGNSPRRSRSRSPSLLQSRSRSRSPSLLQSRITKSFT